MNVKVMKFGGTSLSDRQARQAAYRHVRRELETGRVLVVVSAMGRSPDPYATDTLLQIGSPLLSAQERARLLSIGEQLSSLRVSGELREAGIDAGSSSSTCWPTACGPRWTSMRSSSPAASSPPAPAER